MTEFVELLDKFVTLNTNITRSNKQSKKTANKPVREHLRSYNGAMIHFKKELRVEKESGKFPKIERTINGLRNLLSSIRDIITNYDYDDSWLRMAVIKHIFYHHTITQEGKEEQLLAISIHISDIYCWIKTVRERYEYLHLLFKLFNIVCKDKSLKKILGEISARYEEKLQDLPEEELNYQAESDSEEGEIEGLISKITDEEESKKLGKGVESAMKQLGFDKMIKKIQNRSVDDDSSTESDDEKGESDDEKGESDNEEKGESDNEEEQVAAPRKDKAVSATEVEGQRKKLASEKRLKPLSSVSRKKDE
jgi:hypothetical protein